MHRNPTFGFISTRAVQPCSQGFSQGNTLGTSLRVINPFWALIDMYYNSCLYWVSIIRHESILKKNKEKKHPNGQAWTRQKDPCQAPPKQKIQFKKKYLKNYTDISMHTMSDDKHTILQVTKFTSIPHQMLFTKRSSEFVLKTF